MEPVFVLILLLLEGYFLWSSRWVLALTPPVFSLIFAGLSITGEAPFAQYSPLYYLAFVVYCLALYGLRRLLRPRGSAFPGQDDDQEEP